MVLGSRCVSIEMMVRNGDRMNWTTIWPTYTMRSNISQTNMPIRRLFHSKSSCKMCNWFWFVIRFDHLYIKRDRVQYKRVITILSRTMGISNFHYFNWIQYMYIFKLGDLTKPLNCIVNLKYFKIFCYFKQPKLRKENLLTRTQLTG